jgi:hypothetical protein
MSKFDPPFAIKPLQQVSPGAVVIYRDALAFAGVNRSAPQGQQLVTLAVHDAQQGQFVYRYFDGVQPNVVVPTGEIIVRPNLRTLTENVKVQPATNKLYFADESLIVVQLPNSPDVRLLSLKDGSLVTARTFQMDAFASWEIGVVSLGEFVPLLTV